MVTGSSGFVGTWLIRHLEENRHSVVPGTADITDSAAITAEVTSAAPDAVCHLAGQANVGSSWHTVGETFQVNAVGTLNVLEAARSMAVVPRVLVIGSADVYGTVSPRDLPITENTPLLPVSPYAASKVAAEFLAVQAFLGFGTPVIRARAFNHIGPGQGEGFVVSALAKRIVEAQRDGSPVVTVGNLSARRDFSDVRDVVRAYRLLVESGTPGEVYNVCSGNEISVDEIAQRLMVLSGASLRFEASTEQTRSVDVPVLSGDATKLRATTGWEPQISMDHTLSEVLEWWRAQLL